MKIYIVYVTDPTDWDDYPTVSKIFAREEAALAYIEEQVGYDPTLRWWVKEMEVV